MKNALLTGALISLAALGGNASRDVVRLIEPQAEAPQPQAVAVKVVGALRGLVGTEYVFAVTTTGDAGKPQWLVSPACDLTVSADGRMARIRCEQPETYTVTVACAGKGGDVATDVTFFDARDVDAEVEAEVAARTEVVPAPVPTVAQLALQSQHLPSGEKLALLAGMLRQMGQRLRLGLVPHDVNPIHLIQGQAGEDARGFLEDLDALVEPMRVSGEVTSAPAYADVLESVAVAIGGR